MKVMYYGNRNGRHIAAYVVGSVRDVDVLDTRADHERRARLR